MKEMSILILMLKSARNISSTETQTQKSFLSAPKQARGLKNGHLGLMMKSENGLTNKINDNKKTLDENQAFFYV